MDPVTYHFERLDSAVEELHRLFDAWADDNPFVPALGAYGLEVMRLVVHEWVANLVQHADFGGREARIVLTLAPESARLCCRIRDNSLGFDFDGQLAKQRALVRSGFADGQPPERGRGLMMVSAFTEDLVYRGSGFGGDEHEISFCVASTGTPPPSFASTDGPCRIPF